MRIRLRDLPEEGTWFDGAEPPSILDIRDDGAGDMRFEHPVVYRVFAQIVSDKLLLRGSVETACSMRCVKCGDFFETSAREPSFEVLLDLPETDEFADLTPTIRETMILAFPNYPVCSSGCLGVCPGCGARLGKEPCKCAAVEDVRWSALNTLDYKEKS